MDHPWIASGLLVCWTSEGAYLKDAGTNVGGSCYGRLILYFFILRHKVLGLIDR
jgi:hypothetical protein